MRHEEFDSHLVSRNVRYLLWKKDVPKVNWIRRVIALLGWEEAKVKGFLQGQVNDSELTGQELVQLSINLGLSEDGSEIRFEDIARGNPNLLQENFQYLVGGLEHGKKQNLAKRLGVSPTTISRWLSGVFEPRSSALKQIALFFGLPEGIDLKTHPVFLSLEPVTLNEKKLWLIRQLKGLSQEELNELFPALRRILA